MWQRAEEHQLQEAVDEDADEDRADHGPRHVSPRIVGLARELVGLLEAQVGEDDSARRDC